MIINSVVSGALKKPLRSETLMDCMLRAFLIRVAFARKLLSDTSSKAFQKSTELKFPRAKSLIWNLCLKGNKKSDSFSLTRKHHEESTKNHPRVLLRSMNWSTAQSEMGNWSIIWIAARREFMIAFSRLWVFQFATREIALSHKGRETRCDTISGQRFFFFDKSTRQCVRNDCHLSFYFHDRRNFYTIWHGKRHGNETPDSFRNLCCLHNETC